MKNILNIIIANLICCCFCFATNHGQIELLAKTKGDLYSALLAEGKFEYNNDLNSIGTDSWDVLLQAYILKARSDYPKAFSVLDNTECQQDRAGHYIWQPPFSLKDSPEKKFIVQVFMIERLWKFQEELPADVPDDMYDKLMKQKIFGSDQFWYKIAMNCDVDKVKALGYHVLASQKGDKYVGLMYETMNAQEADEILKDAVMSGCILGKRTDVSSLLIGSYKGWKGDDENISKKAFYILGTQKNSKARKFLYGVINDTKEKDGLRIGALLNLVTYPQKGDLKIIKNIIKDSSNLALRQKGIYCLHYYSYKDIKPEVHAVLKESNKDYEIKWALKAVKTSVANKGDIGVIEMLKKRFPPKKVLQSKINSTLRHLERNETLSQ